MNIIKRIKSKFFMGLFFMLTSVATQAVWTPIDIDDITIFIWTYQPGDDFDADGIPDEWELANGLQPQIN